MDPVMGFALFRCNYNVEKTNTKCRYVAIYLLLFTSGFLINRSSVAYRGD